MWKLLTLWFVAASATFMLLWKLYQANCQAIMAEKGELRIGNLGVDTLSLYARYSECGEWGGHREVIHIHMSELAQKKSPYSFWEWKGPRVAVWLIDTVICPQPDRRYTKQATIQLTPAQEADVLRYAQNLTIRSFRQGPPTHAADAFSLRYKQTQIKIYPADDWEEFAGLRSRLFPNAR